MKKIKINESQIYDIVDELSKKLTMINESDEDNTDLIKEDLQNVFVAFKEYKLNNSANADEKILLNEIESLFSQYDMI